MAKEKGENGTEKNGVRMVNALAEFKWWRAILLPALAFLFFYVFVYYPAVNATSEDLKTVKKDFVKAVESLDDKMTTVSKNALASILSSSTNDVEIENLENRIDQQHADIEKIRDRLPGPPSPPGGR